MRLDDQNDPNMSAPLSRDKLAVRAANAVTRAHRRMHFFAPSRVKRDREKVSHHRGRRKLPTRTPSHRRSGR